MVHVEASPIAPGMVIGGVAGQRPNLGSSMHLHNMTLHDNK